jgi:ribosomal-protein-serine acetyltransferase
MEGKLQISDGAYLRLLEEADARELHTLIEANRAYLARWLPWAAGQTFEDTLDFICGTRSQARENEGFQTAIVTKKGLVGVIGYVSVDWANRSTRVGYWLDEGLGFRQEGTLRQFQLIDGRYLDCVSYSMLATDWRAAG